MKHPSILDVRGKGIEEEFNIQAKAVQEMKRKNGRETLWILSMDTYESFSDKDKSAMGRYIARGTAMCREFGDVVVMLAKPSTYSLQLISDNCDIHLKLEEVNGSLIMFGKRPPTSSYGLTYDFDKGYPKVLLTRIM